MRTRQWWVSAKPFPRPRDGYKYKTVEGPFGDPVQAARFVAANFPVDAWERVAIYSKVRTNK